MDLRQIHALPKCPIRGRKTKREVMKSIAMAAFAATLALASISTASATANAPAIAREYTIDYNELALRDIVGTRLVYRDIVSDAKRICGAEGYALRNNMSKAECVDHVVGQSIREIGNKALTNIHNQHS